MSRGLPTQALAAGAGVALIALTRLLLPAAPPLYDGIQIAPEPFHYVSPPPSLASTNKPATGGTDFLDMEGGANKLKVVETADKQVIAYFPKGSVCSDGATRIKVTITPVAAPPSTPPNAKLVGNDYSITAAGDPGNLPVTMCGLASNKTVQLLLRVPPVEVFTEILVYHDSGWHPVPWSASVDVVNVSLIAFGDVAALNDPTRKPTRVTPSGGGLSAATIFEIVAVAIAATLVVAAVVVQRRRVATEDETPPSR